ncbi:hypothetical protein ABC255_10810 [Neobacillus sp. 3P2-tot-E-2]|uniref:hypothetical protein n=1 Tax=Neobacillus sp. 3P2-tot-E-2 TaxID=3132212 RepID=UPI00399F80FC
MEDQKKLDTDKIPNKHDLHIMQRGDFVVKLKCGERGTFNAEKAARGLIELTNKIKKQNVQNKNNNDKAK